MKKQNLIISMLLLGLGTCVAQSNFGPKITAMGQNCSAVADVWGMSANPALITDIDKPTLAMTYFQYLATAELSKQSAGFVRPYKNQTLGICIQRYGIIAYHEIKASGMLAKKFGNLLSIASRINLHQLEIKSYGATTGFSVDVGAAYKLTEQVVVGSYFNNLSFQRYDSRLVKITIPTTFYLGLCYAVSDKVAIASTLKKEFGFYVDISIGLDYKLLDFLSLRSGLTVKPFKQYAGFGVKLKRLIVDIAVQSDPFLAYAPQIGIAYAW